MGKKGFFSKLLGETWLETEIWQLCPTLTSNVYEKHPTIERGFDWRVIFQDD